MPSPPLDPALTQVHPPPSLRGPLTLAEVQVLLGYIQRMEEIEVRTRQTIMLGVVAQLLLVIATVAWTLVVP